MNKKRIWKTRNNLGKSKNNVYISILSKNILPIENHFLNNAFITNMICSVIENICNVKTQIKWPNDILINKEKFLE